MRSLATVFAVVLSLGATAAACSPDEDNRRAPRVELDGSPRRPTAEGVVVSVTRHQLVLDGGRAFAIEGVPQSFSTTTGETSSLLARKGQYVHVGADDGLVGWVAGIGVVDQSDLPTVYYIGRIRQRKARELIFEDGTVLRLPNAVAVPAGDYVRVELDPDRHRIRAIVAL